MGKKLVPQFFFFFRRSTAYGWREYFEKPLGGDVKNLKEHAQVTICLMNFPLSSLAGFNWRVFVGWVGHRIFGSEKNCLRWQIRS